MATELDLVTATGGITGAFAVVKPASVPGFVRQTSQRIALVGLFATPAQGSRLVDTVAFANTAITSGTAQPSLLAALTALADVAGTPNPAAFARLTPEPYATASRIGEEQALLVADALRTSGDRAPMPGWSGFAHALGGWRALGGGAGGGAGADIATSGLLGGIEYAGARVSVAGFIGGLESTQRVGALDARTEADGLIAGARIAARLGSATLAATILHDGTSARTRRGQAGPGATRLASSRYDIGGWTIDMSAAYALDAGRVSVAPTVGLTWSALDRAGAREDGGPFALTVAAGGEDVWHGDAGVRVTADLGRLDGPAVRPFAALGVRHRLSGEVVEATAAFASAPAGAATLTTEGVARARTAATVAAGLDLDLSARVRLFAAYQGEFARDTDRQSVTGGIKIGF